MKPVPGFKCDFCHRVFGRPVDAINHERACRYNPERRMCVTCKHYEIRSMNDDARGNNVPTCAYHNEPIFEKPYFIECATHDYGGWGPEQPMPGTCSDYEQKEEELGP